MSEFQERREVGQSASHHPAPPSLMSVRNAYSDVEIASFAVSQNPELAAKGRALHDLINQPHLARTNFREPDIHESAAHPMMVVAWRGSDILAACEYSIDAAGTLTMHSAAVGPAGYQYQLLTAATSLGLVHMMMYRPIAKVTCVLRSVAGVPDISSRLVVAWLGITKDLVGSQPPRVDGQWNLGTPVGPPNPAGISFHRRIVAVPDNYPDFQDFLRQWLRGELPRLGEYHPYY